ncbi:MAG: prepilin-type N-terminal cleavage/methylation domain-containing protein [Planctomycetota bacterium]
MSRRVPGIVKRGFTLVEILIVVVILGILAAIVVPQFASASDDARVSAFATSILSMDRAIRLYQGKYAEYPGDPSSGDLPAGLDEFIAAEDYENGTPLGGVWDIEVEYGGITGTRCLVGAAEGAIAIDDDLMLRVDAVIDDGVDSTGAFQQSGTRYYWVVR